jgi:hypothetical protein
VHQVNGTTSLRVAAQGPETQDVVYRLNEVGLFVWERLDGLRSVTSLAEVVAGRYSVERVEAENDLYRFLARLQQIGAVCALADDTASDTAPPAPIEG